MKTERITDDDRYESALEIDGIEIFEPDIVPDIAGQEPDTAGQLEAVPITEASARLGVSERTIRRRIRGGKLATKKDCDGRTLVLCPAAPDTAEQTPDSVKQMPDSNRHEERIDPLVTELMAKLEVLTYRNGYLEAQLENHREQIKLLTDSEHNKTGWWKRFCNWITGGDRDVES